MFYSVPNSCPTSPSRHGGHHGGYGPLRHGGPVHLGAQHRAAHAAVSGIPGAGQAGSRGVMSNAVATQGNVAAGGTVISEVQGVNGDGASPFSGQSTVQSALELLDGDQKPDLNQLGNQQNTINLYPADESQDLSPMPATVAPQQPQQPQGPQVKTSILSFFFIAPRYLARRQMNDSFLLFFFAGRVEASLFLRPTDHSSSVPVPREAVDVVRHLRLHYQKLPLLQDG